MDKVKKIQNTHPYSCQTIHSSNPFTMSLIEPMLLYVYCLLWHTVSQDYTVSTPDESRNNVIKWQSNIEMLTCSIHILSTTWLYWDVAFKNESLFI